MKSILPVIFGLFGLLAVGQAHADVMDISGSFNPSEISAWSEATASFSADIYTDSKQNEHAKDVVSSTYTISVSGGTIDQVSAGSGTVSYTGANSAVVTISGSSASTSISVTIQPTAAGSASVSVSGSASLSDGTTVGGSDTETVTVDGDCAGASM